MEGSAKDGQRDASLVVRVDRIGGDVVLCVDSHRIGYEILAAAAAAVAKMFREEMLRDIEKGLAPHGVTEDDVTDHYAIISAARAAARFLDRDWGRTIEIHRESAHSATKADGQIGPDQTEKGKDEHER